MLKIKSHIIFFLLIFPFFAGAQDPVSLNCVGVSNGGEVTIWWKTPINTTGFERYEIYFSASGLTFSKIDEIANPLANQYNHAAAQANLGSRYYFVKAVYNGSEAVSDTLNSIFLQVDNNAPLFNLAGLYWNPVGNPLPGGSSGIYQVFEEYPLGNWFLRTSTSSLSELLSIIVCNDSISFRIEMENSQGCVSVSNIGGAVFKDAIYPVKPVFDSVSINSAGRPILGWAPAVDGDVSGYIIYRFENGIWLEIDRINDRDSTYYTDENSDPCSAVFTFAIASIDSCGNKSPGTFSEPLSTILIENVVFDVCSMASTVSWSPYINAVPGLEGYQIFCGIYGAAFQPVGFVAADQLNFEHTGLASATTYTYFVQAEFGGRSSSSCKRAITTSSYEKPQFVYLTNASVLSFNSIELTVEVDTAVASCTWEIWSSNQNNSTPVLAATVSRAELTGFPLSYTDESADGSLAWYSYYVLVKDSCGKEILESNQLTTIHLAGAKLNTDQYQLDWTAFEGWEEGVEKYYIFRFSGDEVDLLPIDSVGPQTLTYTDNISGIAGGSGEFTYWVQALQSAGNPFGYREKSNSNRLVLTASTPLFFPNAFRPKSTSNNTFGPVYRFFGGTQYLLQIYNRWGQLIWETKDAMQNWDGQVDGQNVEMGVYVYRVVYTNPDNQTVVMHGTVTVVE